jgi:hypothetical protein
MISCNTEQSPERSPTLAYRAELERANRAGKSSHYDKCEKKRTAPDNDEQRALYLPYIK